MSVIQEIVEAIDRLTLVEVAELKSELEKRFGVFAPTISPMISYIAPGDSVPELQTEFEVHLLKAGEQKINVIKLVREILSLDLKSSKDFVDTLPKVVKGELSKDEANAIASKLESAGATAVVQ